MGHVSSRRAGAHDPPQPIEHFAQIVVALRGVLSNEREVRSNELPLFVRNVTWGWFSSSHDQMLSYTGTREREQPLRRRRRLFALTFAERLLSPRHRSVGALQHLL